MEWRALAVKRTDGRPVLAVIVGRKGLHVELMAASGERIQLLPIFSDWAGKFDSNTAIANLGSS